MNSTNGANKLGCVSEHISEMQTDDGSLGCLFSPEIFWTKSLGCRGSNFSFVFWVLNVKAA